LLEQKQKGFCLGKVFVVPPLPLQESSLATGKKTSI
jgi:hypothetical protein